MTPWPPPIPPNINTNPSFPYSPGPGIWDTSLAWGTAPAVDASGSAPSPAYSSNLTAPLSATATTFTAAAAPAAALPVMVTIDGENILVTAAVGSTLTGLRAQSGTAAAVHLVGAVVTGVGYYPADATQLNLKSLGTGIAIQPVLWLPDGAWFTINGAAAVYEIQSDAQLANGRCVGVVVAPGLAVAVADDTPITDYNALCTDNDLTLQESRMPALAKKTVAIGSGATAYAGKRALAKRDLGQWIYRRGYELSGLLDLTEFNRSAVFLELSYIYRDMATRNDEISADKAAYYLSQYGSEIESVRFDYQPPQSSISQFQQRPVCSWWRS